LLLLLCEKKQKNKGKQRSINAVTGQQQRKPYVQTLAIPS